MSKQPTSQHKTFTEEELAAIDQRILSAIAQQGTPYPSVVLQWKLADEMKLALQTAAFYAHGVYCEATSFWETAATRKILEDHAENCTADTVRREWQTLRGKLLGRFGVLDVDTTLRECGSSLGQDFPTAAQRLAGDTATDTVRGRPSNARSTPGEGERVIIGCVHPVGYRGLDNGPCFSNAEDFSTSRWPVVLKIKTNVSRGLTLEALHLFIETLQLMTDEAYDRLSQENPT